MPTRQALLIAVSARIFVLAALTAPIVWYRDRPSLIALGVLAGIWLMAQIAERSTQHPARVITLEAVLVGAVCGLVLDAAPALLLSLALPPFLAAIYGGLPVARLALAAELIAVLAALLVSTHRVSAEQGLSIFTWGMAGLGLGLIGSFVHEMAERDPGELAAYLDAQRLIRRLLDLSGDLSYGLDVTSLAGSVVSDVRDQLPTSALGLYLPRGELLVPLVTKLDDPLERLGEAEALAVESWARGEPLVYQRCFAFPLGDAAVVAGLLSDEADIDVEVIERSILSLCQQLRTKAVQLDTALLFSDFRDLASSDVRQRLAREMHDGVAQDIASLGYLVDALASRPADDGQAQQLRVLRERITTIVAEVRQSVLTLRTSIGESQSLGAAIGSVARHLSESSGIPIRVRLDEQSTRLRPEVEAELFRITQEAMNNAIKHARCTAIDVTCQVHAPDALIVIRDDGRGLQPARGDSHGLKIMHERARLAGAALSITDGVNGGLEVSVRIGKATAAFPRSANAERITP
ncbi:MAG: histidine kinase [Nocardioides sp.]